MTIDVEAERPGEELGGLVPVSRASRIANGFLLWYLAGSLIWIFGGDQLILWSQRTAPVPEWMHSVKGGLYVLVFGLILRSAARRHVASVEGAHQAYIEGKLELVRRLARAAEYRDDETGGHNARIGRFAAIVAREIGLDPPTCALLGAAAPLHDLGKIGIPDALLHKAGPLTVGERAQMERHTELGAEILAGARHPLVRAAHTIALTHHERWDGTGYPQRLRGAAIPLEGRIVAVCDVFDALTTARPYKKAWSVGAAVAEIERGRGSHFDPAVVDAFSRCLFEILRAKEEFSTTTAPEARLAA